MDLVDRLIDMILGILLVAVSVFLFMAIAFMVVNWSKLMTYHDPCQCCPQIESEK